ncbi:MerR family transcriptional regulator [Proteinivorax tanatarense]|uniref:MerR family transcriptional regulator n=1 Tax=Proteinivorax tanatarense TaxID=1260629 RepID=A0AAU7VJW3_9FIRM
MKISKFSEKHDVPKSTIRFYIKLGLLIPNKHNSQYIFDEQCDKTIYLINKMKKFNFNLEEIQEFLSFNILSASEDEEYLDYMLKLYKKKKVQLLINKKEIDEILEVMDSEIYKISKRVNKKSVLGIPLHFLNLLACPWCNNDIIIDSDNVRNNSVLDGKGCCSNCNYSFIIQEGIIITSMKFKDEKYMDFDQLKRRYINNTDKELIHNVYLAASWVGKKVLETNLSNKIIMKNTTGLGAFLSRLSENLPEDSCFISVDNNLDSLKYAKKIVEKKKHRPDIIFICSNYPDIPLQNYCVDIIIDKVNGSFYDSQKTEKVMKNISFLNKMLKKDGLWVGTYVYFNLYDFPKLLDEKYQKYYSKVWIKELFNKYFNQEDSLIHEPITLEVGEYGSFLERGNNVNQWTYLGRKK